MSDLPTWLHLSPQLPKGFPDPFVEGEPHPLARFAAEELGRELEAGVHFPDVSFHQPGAGKMFGVLVVQAADGRVGWLCAFSGMVGGQWRHPGFVPPLFDPAVREPVEIPGEASVKQLGARIEAFERSPEWREARQAVADLDSSQRLERESMRQRHAANRDARAAQRAVVEDPQQRHALDQESRADKAEKRRQDERHARAMAEARASLEVLERRLVALHRLRRMVSRSLMKRLHDTYEIVNARGERSPLRVLYPGAEPPSGAGDCAAPKLLGYAYAQNLQPLAMAEFWWGAPPSSGGRRSGAFYPPCRSKCAPLLSFMLQGLEVSRPALPAPADLSLRVIHQDEWLVVVSKPAGLLSVPGRSPSDHDSVQSRLRALFPDAEGPLLVHRLDQDTSGLLVAALDPHTHRHLQRQFARREVSKQYVAWLASEVAGTSGEITLPLRVDLEDRPRQIHDPVHGKAALTRWRVLERRDGRTRVELSPHTGRTHQLRVHAAHHQGLAAPIVGDRLYGHAGERLLLHACRLEFVHPGTGQTVVFESPAPF